MSKKAKKLFNYRGSAEPSAGLFNRIVSAIKKEQELRHTRRLLWELVVLLVVSIIATPLSLSLLVNQIQSSGVYYFVSAALMDFNTFLKSWQDFGLAILESLPIGAILIFTISIGICLFTLRLFLYKKRLLMNYLFNQRLTINI
jgi:hypothetical protein